MSFRYKSALISLVSLVAICGWYFGGLFLFRHEGLEGAGFGALVAMVVLLVIVQIAGHIVVAILSRDRSGKLDERERAFDRNATMIGYYALIVGLFGLLPFVGGYQGGAALANAIVLLMVVAECARQAVFVTQYHRVG